MRIKLDIPIPPNELARMVGAYRVKTLPCRNIVYVCTDTRELCAGDLFFALRGERFDGNDYIEDAKRLGAYTVGMRGEGEDLSVTNTQISLSLLAKNYKKLLPLRATVAITGSVGKSTTKELTLKLLSTKFKAHGTYENLNNEIGVPLTVLAAGRDTEVLIIEAGMNHRGELGAISRCIEPDISVITNVGCAHIGNLGSREGIARAKEEILCGMHRPFLLAPADDNYINEYPFKKTVSAEGSDADFSLIPKGDRKYTFRSERNDLSEFEIRSNMLHIPKCLAFALAICSVLGMSDKEMLDAVSAPELEDDRRIHSIGALTVIDDSYNSSPEAVFLSLKTLMGYNSPKGAVLGDMLELGEFSDELHFKIGELAADVGLSTLYAFGEKCGHIKAGAMSKGMNEKDIFTNDRTERPEITAEQILKHSQSGTLLLKGSRGMRLERILKILKES